MIQKASWILYDRIEPIACPAYQRVFQTNKKVLRATLFLTACGVYTAYLNGKRIGREVLAPGWTVYEKRHQYQEYDITSLIAAENELVVTVANGWFQFEPNDWMAKLYFERKAGAIIGLVELLYEDGEVERIFTDEAWKAGICCLLYSDIYNGEIYDANEVPSYGGVRIMDYPKEQLIPQEGEIICEHERIKPLASFVTPKGERVLDFGQNLTGYVEFRLHARKGDCVSISHAEVLDADGNFYRDNYRKAKANITYYCKDGEQTYKPRHNFYGFRYIRLDEYPGEIFPEDFTAIAVYSDIKRTGHLTSGHALLNRLFSNIFWGQKNNYLDIPTDCPQRDERLGWTGDAQVFMKAACYNYKVDRFFDKWLADLRAEQWDNGMVTQTVPDVLQIDFTSTAWGDAAVTCPWQLYLVYGDRERLRESYPSMKKWIDYICSVSTEPDLWIGGCHHGDHLSIDGRSNDWDSSCHGASDHDLIASAIYANSVSIVIRAGKVLGEEVSEYEERYRRIVAAFRQKFPVYHTQTECVLAIVYDLAEDMEATVETLRELVHQNGDALTTGFVGTPHLLHALTKGGDTELAYTLLLREDYPSWLFSVRMGATTVWEHWDGVREDGSMWDSAMNSFNHYSFGAVLDWVYEVAAGIQPVEEVPGFGKLKISPHPDRRLGHLEARLKTRYGEVRSYWNYQHDGKIRYEISVPTQAEITIDGKQNVYPAGDYVFYSKS